MANTVRPNPFRALVQYLRSIPFFELRNRHLMVWDIVVQPVIAYLALLIRLETVRFGQYRDSAFQYGILSALIVPAVFYLMGVYRRFWRYASLREAELIVISSIVAELLQAFLYIIILTPLNLVDRIPYSIPIISTLLLIIAVTLPRYLVRLSGMLSERRSKTPLSEVREPVLLAGAGNAGVVILREIQANPQLGYLPVGFVDDDPRKLGLHIMGCQVLGKTDQIPALVSKHQIKRVFLCMPRASGATIRRLIELCRKAGVPVLTVPGMYEVLSGSATVNRLRAVSVEDLLRRTPVDIDQSKVRSILRDHCILVTGAGGSIGSEICRQVASSHPERLVLLGHGENSIYHIHQELITSFPDLAVDPVIADIRDQERIDHILARYQPAIILHAAAHKHVPLMESNVPDAVTNNIFGTLNLVESAIAHRVPHLVMISSDKAVNPANIMGTTKRVAELIVQDAARRSGLAFTMVRFGNVIGSNGSVVPLFKKQIEQGGPVTVTHADMSRYFMTIPEAVRLVLQAATMGKGGEIFVLDMGEPIRIDDLARDMIRLSGLEPGKDIEITYTGLRPGEKMSEEISVHNEHHIPSPHKKVFILRQDDSVACEEQAARLNAQLDALRAAVQNDDLIAINALLAQLVPECSLHE